MCGATELGEALRRIGEGAAMIRSKGEAGTGDIVNAVTHLRKIRSELRWLSTLGPEEIAAAAKQLQSPLPLVREVAAQGQASGRAVLRRRDRHPGRCFAGDDVGAEGVFVGSGIFKSSDPECRARAIVEATTHYADPARVASASTGLGAAMESIETSKLDSEQLLSPRGW